MDRAPAENLDRLLLAAFRAFDREADEALNRHGLPDVRPVHVALFESLDADGTRLTTLAERLGMTKQALQSLADELEDLGYARRSPDPDDGRARLLVVTARGRSKLSEARAVIGRLEGVIHRRLGTEQFSSLVEALRTIGAT